MTGSTSSPLTLSLRRLVDTEGVSVVVRSTLSLTVLCGEVTGKWWMPPYLTCIDIETLAGGEHRAIGNCRFVYF